MCHFSLQDNTALPLKVLEIRCTWSQCWVSQRRYP